MYEDTVTYEIPFWWNRCILGSDNNSDNIQQVSQEFGTELAYIITP